MTTNDQAAMNEQLTQLRLNGLSIDGDNRYKQDLIDAVIGAMMFGAQGANPPPAGHWLEQFYVIAREEREALARVEAERDAMEAMVGMLEEKEWAEHAGRGPISNRLEACITELHGEISDAHEAAPPAAAHGDEAVRVPTALASRIVAALESSGLNADYRMAGEIREMIAMCAQAGEGEDHA